MLIIFTLTSNIQTNILADSRINSHDKIAYVAVIFHRIDDPYMIRLRESLENIEKDSKNNIKFTFFDSKNNLAIENQILDSVLKSKFDLLILNLADKNKNAVENIINSVKPKNIPLILMNIPQEVVSNVSKLYSKAAFVAPDSKQAGIAEGEILVDLWNRDKNDVDYNGDDILQYVLLEGKSDDPQAIDRTKYVISTINNSGIKNEQLALIDAGWLKDLAKISVDNLYLKYDGKIEAIISNNDAMALGAIEALQKYGYNTGDKSKNVAVVGIDGLPEAINLIDKGFMTGTIIQDPKVEAEMFYTIGMNMVNNLNPIENTNYKMVDGEIIIPFPYNAYKAGHS
jgi:methyl-galactoside transport system substrate-binding protein